MRRTDMTPEERKAFVVNQARDLFTSQGYAATSTAAIATAAQISEMTLFRYFPHKRDVFLAVIEPLLRVDSMQSLRTSEGVMSPERRMQQLESFLRERLEFVRNHRGLVLMVVIESHLQTDLAGDVNPMHSVQKQLRHFLRTIGVSTDDEQFIVQVIAGGLLSLLFSPVDPQVEERMIQFTIASIQTILSGSRDRA